MSNLFLVGQWYAQCVEWHQKEVLTWILGATNASQSTREGLIANQPELEIYILVVEIYFVIWGNTFSWNATYLPFKLFWLVQPMHLNRAVEVSSQPKIAPPLQNFLLGRWFFSFLLSPACVQKPSLRPSGAVARDASQWDRRPGLRFEITLRGFSNRQKLPSIIEHSWLMQWMQLDKASNFLMLLAVKIQDCVCYVFKAGHLDGTFRTHFLCKHPSKAPERW